MLDLCLAGAAWAADAKAGQAVYDKSCKTCHGADGAPNPAIAKAMKADMKDMKSAEIQSMSNDQIKKAITEGTGKMKPVKTLSAVDVDNVIAYIHTLKK
jgi:mono/diheme cytochrome c family protein